MSEATDMLASYIAAEKAVLEGKTYRRGDRLLTMEDLPEIRKGRQEWEARAAAEANQAAGKPSRSPIYLSF